MGNTVIGIATAWHAASPVLVLVARLPNSWTEADAESDNLRLDLVLPVVKWARTVPSAERLVEYVDVACRHALTGRPGPVVLQLPQEFLSATVQDAGAALLPPPVFSRPEPDPLQVEEAATLIAAAERPLIICGAGATRGQAGPGLARLHAEFKLPVTGNGLGRGLVPEDWERSFNSYLDLPDGGRGVRFVGRFVQDAAPLRNDQLRYVFQGIADGSWLVVASLPISTAALPQDTEVAVVDPGAPHRDITVHLEEWRRTFNGLRAADFEPSLDVLDRLLRSVTVSTTDLIESR